DHVCFTPESGHVRCNLGCPLWANSGHSRVKRKTASRRSLRNPTSRVILIRRAVTICVPPSIKSLAAKNKTRCRCVCFNAGDYFFVGATPCDGPANAGQK